MVNEKFKVLCVDDEPDIAGTLLRAFRKDFDVVIATSGLEGIELIRAQSFDLIISDQRMPGVTGDEVLKFAKETQPEAIRILLTGYSDIESLVKCVNEAGIYKYISKPWEPEILRLTVLHALETQYLKEKLRNSEKILMEAQKVAGLGSYVLDITTGLWEGSEVLDKLLGIDKTYDRTVEGWVALIHPDDRIMMADYFNNKVIGQCKDFDKEYRIIRCNDQATLWLHGLGKLEFDAQGHPVKMLGTIQNITERKRAEEVLRIAAVTFESHDAILITDKHTNIVRSNRSFSDVTGYSEDELIGKTPRILSSGRHDRSFYIEMWQELTHNGHWSGEIWDKTKNGQIYPKWLTITAVKGEQQEATHYVAIYSDVTARKHAEEEIHKLAFYDELTKLPNRRLFLDRLQAALNASARRNDYGALMFIDLDCFKELNDEHGHEQGDLLLIEVGARIKSCVREMDTVARYGGDEFVVLIESSSSDLNEAILKNALVAEKIRGALVQPYKLKEHEHHSSPSIGICLYHGNEETLEILIEHADMAMYQVKKSGRNAVRFFDSAMEHNAVKHNALKKDLQHALAKQQLQLHFQIQVDKDNHPLGAEAFLRWIHPKHGVIMPSQFISIAEEGPLIIDIDRWVLKMACRQLVLWGKDDKSRKLTLTVNISAKWFAQPDFVSEVADTLKACQVDHALLKLELSERIVLSDLNSSMDKIRALRKLGCRLSIDNFGTVYSSLSFLKLLSPDQLKIHQEFVHSISLNTQDSQLARTIIDFAKSLDLDIFAEGVETEEQQTFLLNQNCNTFQGYLYGKPVPIEEFEVLLNQL